MILVFQRFCTEQSFCISQQIACDLLGNVKAARRLIRPPASSTPEQSFCTPQQIACDLLGSVKAARRLIKPPASSTPEQQILSYWPRSVANELLRRLIGASMCTGSAVGVRRLWESSAFPQMPLDPISSSRLFEEGKIFKNKATGGVGMWASLLVHISTPKGVRGNWKCGQRACTLSIFPGVRAVYVGNVPARCPASCRSMNRWVGSAKRSLDLSLRHFRTHS